MLVNGFLAVGLDAAEIAFGVVRVDAAGSAEEEGGGALGFDAGGAGGGGNADEGGDAGVFLADLGGAVFQHLRVEHQLRVVEDAGDGNAEKGFPFVDELGDRPEVGHFGVGSLEGADEGGVAAVFVKFLRAVTGPGVDGGQIAHLPAVNALARLEVALVAQFLEAGDFLFVLEVGEGGKTDFDAGIGAVVLVFDEVEARLAEFLLLLEEGEENVLGRGVAVDDGGVVGGGALGIFLEPVACLGAHHVLVVGGEKADGGAAADAAGEDGLGGEHQDVIGLDGFEAAARNFVEDVADVFEGAAQRNMAGCLAAGGDERGALGPDGGVVEFDQRSVQVGAHEGVERIGPALDGVLDPVVNHDQVVVLTARRKNGEGFDVLRLDGEAGAGAAEQEPEGFGKSLDAVDEGEGAIEHAGFLLFDGRAAELETAHAGQNAAEGDGGESVVDLRGENFSALQRQTKLAVHPGEAALVHFGDTENRLRPDFAAAEFGAKAGVFGDGDVVLQAVGLGRAGAPAGLGGAVEDEGFGGLELAETRQGALGGVLNLLDVGSFPCVESGEELVFDESGDLAGEGKEVFIEAEIRQLLPVGGLGDAGEGAADRAFDPGFVPGGDAAVAFGDFPLGVVGIRKRGV